MSQRKNKVRRKEKQVFKTEHGNRAQGKLLTVMVWFFVFLLVSCIGWGLNQRLNAIPRGNLQAQDIIVNYDEKIGLEMKARLLSSFLDAVNSLPDLKARASLTSAFRDKKIPARFGQVRADIEFRSLIPEFYINDSEILKGVLPEEIIWSILIHEDVHVDNFLSGKTKVRSISACQRENILKKCSFEYFLEEDKGLEKQLSFLESRNSIKLAPLEILEVFVPGNLKKSALAILRKKYIQSGFVRKEYAQYFDEFEALMLQDEAAVYEVIQK